MNPVITVRLAHLLATTFNDVNTVGRSVEQAVELGHWPEGVDDPKAAVLGAVESMSKSMAGQPRWQDPNLVYLGYSDDCKVHIDVHHWRLPALLNVRFAFDANEQPVLDQIVLDWDPYKENQGHYSFTAALYTDSAMEEVYAKNKPGRENAALWIDTVRVLNAMAETGWFPTESLIGIRRSLDAIAMAE